MLVVTWCTAWALAPHRPRWPRPAAFGFWFGFAVNELPFAALAWLVLVTAAAAVLGSLSTPGAAVIAAVAALTVVGLVVIARRAWKAEAEVRQALLERGVAPPGPGVDAAGRPSLARLIVWPFPVRPRGVRRLRDVEYGEHGRATSLDLYLPAPESGPAPALVFFHGGGFYSGSKSWGAKPLLYRLAAAGWLCASADYRLAPRASYADALGDARRAVEWVHEHAAEYGADPGRVYLAGASAGAHLAATLALSGDAPAPAAIGSYALASAEGPQAAEGSPTAAQPSLGVRGVIALYGYYGPLHRPGRPGGPSSPVDLIGPQAPPFLVVHGGNDSLIPVATARDFARRLDEAAAGPTVYVELGGGEHSFGLFDSIRFRAVVDGVEAFLTSVDGREAATVPPDGILAP